ncbi:MAG: DUF84 family protein [Deltaproteobacteria bacterium]|nr:DUF84 family protein [Deltaproteobacteria bacterium]MBW2496401.1 DUF84 family protein [Deltaproteobacteria bacterium]
MSPQESGRCFRFAPALERALDGEAVRVGTLNRAKLAAVEIVLADLASERSPAAQLSLVPVEVASGVPEQPLGFQEILSGARGRARAAFASGPCALAVGIEDGLVGVEDPFAREGETGCGSGETFNVGCAWVTDGQREGHGLSAGFAYPPDCLEPALAEREPIGALFDALWRRRRDAQAIAESGRAEGNIGKLSGGRLTRSAYGAQAVLCALIRFLHVDLYD